MRLKLNKSKLLSDLTGQETGKGGSNFSNSSSCLSVGVTHFNFRCILITFCLAAIIYEVCWVISVLFGWSSTSGQVMLTDFFPGYNKGLPDLTNVTWAHAVNSRKDLEAALKGSVMMLEADILMGTKEGSTEQIPIMAHPPSRTSDLSFEDFLVAVLKANEQDPKKGIKLDFKQIESVEPVLMRLRKEKVLAFPVWLNADILQGPVNSTRTPVNATQFLALTKKYLPNATLSLGWTTRFGWDDAKSDPPRKSAPKIDQGEYSKQQAEDMRKLWDDFDLDGTYVTFPVRAGLAAQSIDVLINLLGQIGTSRSSLTLWSPIDDTVNLIKLRELIETCGKSRVYVDLPFDLETGPSSARPEFHIDTDTNTNTDFNPNAGNAAGGLSKCFKVFLLVSLIVCSYVL